MVCVHEQPVIWCNTSDICFLVHSCQFYFLFVSIACVLSTAFVLHVLLLLSQCVLFSLSVTFCLLQTYELHLFTACPVCVFKAKETEYKAAIVC